MEIDSDILEQFERLNPTKEQIEAVLAAEA